MKQAGVTKGVLGFGLIVVGMVFAATSWAAQSTVQVVSGEVSPVQRLTSRLLAEPLVAVGADMRETEALKLALAAFDQANDPLDRAPIDRYLSSYPGSPWRFSLLGNLGLAEAYAGRFTEALADFDAAWSAGKGEKNHTIRAFADRIAGERIRLHTRLGHADKVEEELAYLEGRSLIGMASEARAEAREGLWQMRNTPELAFLCGPLALEQLLPAKTAGFPHSIVDTLKPQPGGYHLDQLAQLAHERGLELQPIRREAGQLVPVPSIVHWKAGHYAAIVAEKDGRYAIRDAALGRDYWADLETIDRESSGYFLSKTEQTASYKKILASEAASIVGAGYTGGSNNTDTQPCTKDNCTCIKNTPQGGMVQASAQSMLVSLALTDSPLGYKPAKGTAVPLTLTYSQREAYQPATFHYFNFGPKWTYTGLSYIIDNPQSPGSSVQRYGSGGGTTLYTGYNSANGTFARDERDMSLLSYVPDAPTHYQRRLADGTIEVYAQSDGRTAYPRRFFLSWIVDPAGNALQFNYDTSLRLVSITDADSRSTTFQYDNSDPLLVTGITDPFGRQATITYDGLGRLSSITDVIGITSTVTYAGAGGFVDTLTTPYGTSCFSFGESGTYRRLDLTDPKGETERVEFVHGAPGIPFSESQVPAGMNNFNAYINGRNSFYWDKTAYKYAYGDYTQAHIRHWYHDRTNTSLAKAVLESVKKPLESRIWYNYPGQSWAGANGTCDSPSAIGRVLPDGTTQLTRMEYNDYGNLTRHIDPLGRETAYTYAANGIDVVMVRQKTASGYDTLAEYTWNDQHRPLTIKDVAGQVTTMTYNAVGQMLTQTNALGQTWAYVYGDDGRLARVINPAGAVQASYTYDAAGRIVTETDSEGYTLAHAYDAADRRLRTTYPDGTTREMRWELLDLATVTDRNGLTTRYEHDAVRNLASETNARDEKIAYQYQENGLLAGFTDASGNVTRFQRDIQGRIVAKVYPGGGQETQAWDSAGRLATATDAAGQIRRYRYARDDRLAGITYDNATNPTASVQFADDPVYPRVTSMTDGLGTTRYAYVPAGTPGAGQVAGIDGPFLNDLLSLGYDALGRVSRRTVGGNAETFEYDALGRMSRHRNPLGTFNYGYLGQTGQVVSQALNGGMTTAFDYGSNTQDRMLQAIHPHPSVTPNPKEAPRDWRYHTAPEGIVLGRKATPGQPEGFHYDYGYKLIGVTQGIAMGLDGESYTSDGSIGLPQQGNWSAYYRYDDAGNITGVATDQFAWSGQVNNDNQYLSARGQNWSHDAAGNALDDGLHTYAWDAQHRLIRVDDKATGRYSLFQYDGLSRLTVKKEYAAPGAAPVETRHLWCGDTICQARSSSDAITAQYYDEGEIQGTTPLFYMRDHLGSIVETATATGAVKGRLSYGAYGEPLQADGALPSKRYAGMLIHPQTSFYLTHYRVYDPSVGRWLNRDPIGEQGGINLYAYVSGNPLNLVDPLGLDAEMCTRPLQLPLPYAQHCFIRYNGDNNDTQSYDPNGVHPDPQPKSATCTATQGTQDDACLKKEMQNCQGSDYSFTDHNCCHCAEDAMKACGQYLPPKKWPNWPINPGPQPGEPGYKP